MDESVEIKDVEAKDYEQSSKYYDLDLFPYKIINTSSHRLIKFSDIWFYTTFWSPQNQPVKARLLFVHGFYEHSILYAELLDKLCSEGYECFFYDQRGCGLTSLGKDKGQTNINQIEQDLDNFVTFNHADKNPEVPLYLIGHSAGGAIILDYLAHGKHKDMIKGAIMTAPMISSAIVGDVGFKAMKLITGWSLLGDYKFTNKLKKEHITTNKRYLDFLVSDKLAIPLASVSQFVEMFERGKNLLNKNYEINDKMSILIVQSPDDKIVSYEGTSQFFDKLKQTATSLRKLIPTSGEHSLFIERDEIKDAVFREVTHFLQSNISS